MDVTDADDAKAVVHSASTHGGHWPYTYEHIGWFLSRGALISAIVAGALLTNTPPKSIFDGTWQQQLAASKQKAAKEDVERLTALKALTAQFALGVNSFAVVAESTQSPSLSDVQESHASSIRASYAAFSEKYFGKRNLPPNDKLEDKLLRFWRAAGEFNTALPTIIASKDRSMLLSRKNAIFDEYNKLISFYIDAEVERLQGTIDAR